MYKKDISLGAVSIAFGVWVYYIATTLKKKAAFWPKIVGGGIIILGLILIGMAIYKIYKNKKNAAPSDEAKKKSGANYTRVIAVVGMLIAYFFLFQYFSYTVATALLIFGVAWLLGYKNWKIMIPTSVIMAVVLYFAFSELLNVNFPGIFF